MCTIFSQTPNRTWNYLRIYKWYSDLTVSLKVMFRNIHQEQARVPGGASIRSPSSCFPTPVTINAAMLSHGWWCSKRPLLDVVPASQTSHPPEPSNKWTSITYKFTQAVIFCYRYTKWTKEVLSNFLLQVTAKLYLPLE